MTEDSLESRRSRRRYLRTAGLLTMGMLAGCSNRVESETTMDGDTTLTEPSPTPRQPSQTPSPDGYEHVVDVVEAGADPDGDQSVTNVLDEVVDDDTLIEFPPGTYRFDSTWRFEGYSNLGVVGDRATLVPAPDLQYWAIAFDVADFTFGGFTFDHRGDGVGPQIQVHATGGQNAIHDLTIRGFHDSEEIPVIPNVENEDSSLLIERLRIPDGTEGEAAVYIGPKSVGELTFKDCHLEGCAQGIYGSPHSGPFFVRGGTFLDNNKAAIRVGAANHGAHIQGAHIRVADPKPDRWTSPQNIRGLWLREGMGTVVTDCTIELLDLGGVVSDGAIYLDDTMGTATIRDTTIRVDDDAYAIRAQHPSEDAASLQGDQPLPDAHHLTCENVRVVGSADTLDAIRVIGRNGSSFRNVTVDQPRGERRGLVLASNSADTTVEGGSWVTGAHPIVVEADRGFLSETGCSVRLEDVERLEAKNIADVGSQLAAGTAGEFCVDGTVGVENAEKIVIAVVTQRDGSLFGERVASESYQRP